MRHRVLGLWEYRRGEATEGYTLLSPLLTRETYLIDMEGEVVHAWSHPLTPGHKVCLLENGNLLWSGATAEGPNPAPGKGGLMREYDWNGSIVWEYRDDRQHHDVTRHSNDSTVFIGWEPMPEAAARRVQGAEPGSEDDGTIWSDFLHAVSPGGEIIWEWHAHSGLRIEDFPLHPMSTRREFLHANSVAESPSGGLLLSFRKSSAIAHVDWQSSTVDWSLRRESWGQQHDCSYLQNGNILLFANGIHVPRGMFWSRVVELDASTGVEVWGYQGAPPYEFFSPNVSGAQRLQSGNTLICEGLHGRIFEVTPAGEIVWEFVSPWFGPHMGGQGNMLFRAYRYGASSPQIRGRIG